MNVEWVLDDGELVHLESGLRWVTLCGDAVSSDDVDRDRFSLPEHANDERCRECTLAAHEAADERRRST